MKRILSALFDSLALIGIISLGVIAFVGILVLALSPIFLAERLGYSILWVYPIVVFLAIFISFYRESASNY